MSKNPHIGSNIDDFLEEEGLLASVQMEAIKRVVAYLLQKKIDESAITKSALAKALGTSRSGLERLLDPENTSVTLHTLARAMDYTGKHLEIRISD